MQQVHEQAYDFTRYTHSGHRWLFRSFDEVDSGVVAGMGTQMMWSFDHFFRVAFRSHFAGKVAKVLFSPLRLFDLLGDPRKVYDSASAFYFLGTKASTPLAPVEMPDYYRGPRRR